MLGARIRVGTHTVIAVHYLQAKRPVYRTLFRQRSIANLLLITSWFWDLMQEKEEP